MGMEAHEQHHFDQGGGFRQPCAWFRGRNFYVMPR